VLVAPSATNLSDLNLLLEFSLGLFAHPVSILSCLSFLLEELLCCYYVWLGERLLSGVALLWGAIERDQVSRWNLAD
jgi:hypothetical protein